MFFDAFCCIVDAFILIWSVFLFKKKRIDNHCLLKIEHFKIPILFIFLSTVTALLNFNTKNFPVDFLFETGMIIYYGVCFFIFYGLQVDLNEDKLKKETTKIFKLVAFLNTFFVFLSFVLIFIKKQIIISGTFLENSFRYVVGLHKVHGAQRFTGLYENPNILGFCCVVSLIFFHMLLIKKEFFKDSKKKNRVFFSVVFFSLNFLALMLSDSIASFLLLTVYIVLSLFNKYISLNNRFTFKQKLKNFLIFAFNTLLAVFVLIFLRQGLQESASNVISSISLDNISGTDITDVNFGRETYSLADGNGRLELFYMAIEVLKKHPFFGVGSAKIAHFGQLNSQNGVNLPNSHNGYLSALVCNGFLGFLPFFLFWCTIVYALVGSLLRNVGKRNLDVFPNCVCAVLAYVVYSVSEKTMLSEINMMSIFIWLILGYACTYKKLYLNSDAEFL